MALVLISGATQSGKSIIADKLQRQNYERVPVFTDGLPAVNTPYVHVSKSDMANMQAQGQFVEFKYHAGQNYGLTKKALIEAVDADNDQVIILSPNGVDRVKRYLQGNNIPHLAVFLSVPVITSVERLTNKLRTNSLSSDVFINKMATLAQEERDWTREAYTGNVFDIVFEIAEGHNLNNVVDTITNHIESLKVQQKRMAK